MEDIEFEILFPNGGDIDLMAGLPERYSKLKLTGATSFTARCSFGDMLFNHYAGDGYDIWKSNYLIGAPPK